MKTGSLRELAERCRGIPCHINLIPLNEVRERSCQRSSDREISRFRAVLERHKINVTVRREMGSDIDAACGQLRKRYLDQGQN